MARMARVVVPHYPHHVTQRGNRRQQTFFQTEDYQEYLRLLIEAKSKAGVELLAYCLMPNHVHFAVVPEHKDSLWNLFADAHRQYTRRINFRNSWRGHLWQSRFHSNVMDEAHLMSTVRYIELNPVSGGLCSLPQEWPWSSVHDHLAGINDGLVSVAPMLDRVEDWGAYLTVRDSESRLESIRKHARTGRPIGDDKFLIELEALTGQRLRKRKPGPKVSGDE